MMARSLDILLVVLVVSALSGVGDSGAGDSQVPADHLYEGMPPQEDGSARLGLREAAEVTVQVSIKRKTMRCDDLEAHVEVLQSGTSKAESYACLGVVRPAALTELVVGHGAAERNHYRITFAYAQANKTVTYAIRRVAGAGVIGSQQVVVDVSSPS
jgi:hypothetical protein